MNESKKFAQANNPDLPADQMPDRARRSLSLGLGLLPMFPLLPGCGAGSDDIDPSELSVVGKENRSASAPASQTGVFRHPGLLVTEDDFTRIRRHIEAGDQPWKKWWDRLQVERFATLDTRPNPVEAAYRLDNSKYAMYADIQRSWLLALRWKLTQDDRYADKAVEFLDAWAGKLKAVGDVPPGSNIRSDHTFVLMAGMQGHQWAQVGEIMRTYKRWPAASLKRFQDMLLRVFAPICSSFLNGARIGSHANWDMACLVGAMAIGVFCDKPELYRQACDHYAGNNRGKLRSFGNGSIGHGVYFMHPGHFGQWEESGRDQGHSTLGMSLGGDLMEMAWNQGDDLYGLYNNRFLSAAEYVARSNLLDENGKNYVMPFTPEHNPSQPHPSLWTQVNHGQHNRNAWEPIYNHYVNRMGLAAPNVARMVEFCEPNQWTNSDDIVYPTLIHRRAAYAGPMKPPSGLTAHVHAGSVLLSWWGSVGVASYAVKRSNRANGPFTQLATVSASEVLTYTDTPPQGVWFYQITAQGPGAPSAGSNVARLAFPGEPRLSMPLNDPDRTGTAGAFMNSEGNWTPIQGTLVDGATWGEGRHSSDKALVFDGRKAGLQLPPGLFGDLDDFTVSLWAYCNSLGGDRCMFFSGQDEFSAMALTPRPNHGRGLHFVIYGATGNDEQVVEAPWFMPVRRWVHVAITLRGNTARMYVDGNEVGKSDVFRLSPRQVGDQVSFIGRSYWGQSFDGRIQDFRVHAGALSAAEVAALAR